MFANLLVSCVVPETGIDHSDISGTVTIPPATLEERDGRSDSNDTLGQAIGLGPEENPLLTYRAVVVTGSTDTFLPDGSMGDITGDEDWFHFSPVADGTFTIEVHFSAGVVFGDTGGESDGNVLKVEVVDIATYDVDLGTGIVWSGDTTGSAGAFVLPLELVAGGDYALLVAGQSGDETVVPMAWEMVFSGSVPTRDLIKLGGYAGEDGTLAEAPLAGTGVDGWVYVPETRTWEAPWRMLRVRSVVSGEDADTADEVFPQPTVVEGAEQIYVRGGTITSLNASPSAGALYASANVPVSVSGGTVVVDDPVVMDGVFPKVIGLQVVETEPDTTVAVVSPADTTLDLATLLAQDMGIASGVGFVDVIDGGSDMTSGVEGWGDNDGDAFSFTVAESVKVKMVASWPDPAADVDLGIFGPYEDGTTIDYFGSFGATYCMTAADPEVCTMEVTLDPGVTYWVVVLGYLGTDIQPYHIELEWLRP